MNTLKIPCPVGQVSDGYHTFDELYEHRCMLFLALMKLKPDLAWISTKHDDGTEMVGWFVAGMILASGDVTYHMPDSLWEYANHTGACSRPTAPPFDGHTSADVVRRLKSLVKNTGW